MKTTLFSEAPAVWPPDTESWLTGKDLHGGKDLGQEKGVAEYEMAGWHHQSNGHEFEQTLEDSGGFPVLVYEVYGVTKSRTWLSDWTTNNNNPFLTAYTRLTWTRSSYGYLLYFEILNNFSEGFTRDGGADGTAAACHAGNPGLIPGLGRSPGEGNGNPIFLNTK